MTPAEIHQAKRAHVRQQAERWAAAADTTGNHALSTFVQLVRDALRDLEALEASQNAKCGGCRPMKSQDEKTGVGSYRASGGPENGPSVRGDLPTDEMVRAGWRASPVLMSTEDMRRIGRAMEAARPKTTLTHAEQVALVNGAQARIEAAGQQAASLLSASCMNDSEIREWTERQQILGDPRRRVTVRTTPDLSTPVTAHPSDFIYPAKS